MIRYELDETSLNGVVDHVEQTRMNILAAVRFGMMEGMSSLAGTIVERMPSADIESRTGNLEGSILSSPRVIETEQYIKGEVSSATAKYRNLGLWLEFGTKFPVKGKGLAKYPAQFMHSFAPATRESILSHGHGAFRIAPRPFFGPPSREMFPTILDTIAERIAEAVGE